MKKFQNYKQVLLWIGYGFFTLLTGTILPCQSLYKSLFTTFCDVRINVGFLNAFYSAFYFHPDLKMIFGLTWVVATLVLFIRYKIFRYIFLSVAFVIFGFVLLQLSSNTNDVLVPSIKIS